MPSFLNAFCFRIGMKRMRPLYPLKGSVAASKQLDVQLRIPYLFGQGWAQANMKAFRRRNVAYVVIQTFAVVPIYSASFNHFVMETMIP